MDHRMNRNILQILALAVILCAVSGWGAAGHRTITYLALDGLSPEAPAWLTNPVVRDRIAYQASEPDRWRGWASPILQHEHKQDHYLDVELLEQFGLTLDTVPKLRSEYLRAMIIAKHEHPEQVGPYDPATDPDRTKEWPGQALHGVAEQYAKLQSALNQARVIEALSQPQRAAQLEQARANVIYHMGVLSHYVGDLAQPLHTTKHFNGWVDDNPNQFTTDKKFHAFIDTGVVELHGVTYAGLRPLIKYDATVNAADPWDDVVAYVRRSFVEMQPLYELEKSGELRGPAGKELIERRMLDAGATLAAIYRAAYASSAPTPKQIADFQYFDESLPNEIRARPSTLPAAQTQPATAPAAPPPSSNG